MPTQPPNHDDDSFASGQGNYDWQDQSQPRHGRTSDDGSTTPGEYGSHAQQQNVGSDNGFGWPQNNAGQGYSGYGPGQQPDYPADNYGGYPGNGYPSYSPDPRNNATVDKPANYLVWTIVSTVLCCLPLGITGIVFSTRVDKYFYEGRVDDAIKASQRAKLMAILSVVFGLIGSIGYVLILMVAGQQ